MSGHSKWSNIKRAKGAVDSKRGKIFTKLSREIMVSARLGGGDPGANSRLRDAISEARANNMPKDNVERAIKRGTGGLDSGASFEEITYEGYGPGGVAILIESMTDNRNRTIAEIRAKMTRNGGNLGEAGSVSWMFEKKGLIVIKKDAAPEDVLMDTAIEAGASDINDEGDIWEIITDIKYFHSVKDALEKASIQLVSASISAISSSTIKLEGDKASQMIKLMEQLEDLDDVQKVFANFDIDDAELSKLAVD